MIKDTFSTISRARIVYTWSDNLLPKEEYGIILVNHHSM